uniref:Uncharacterized protein n=1 Tax=Arundo donax TaxID=35708 RepID=A0A0A8Z743_ARUDO
MVHKLGSRNIAHLPHLGIELRDHFQDLLMLRMALVFHHEHVARSMHLYQAVARHLLAPTILH